MKKILLYPYDITNIHFLQYTSNRFSDYKIEYIVSPHGWGYAGEDAGEKVGIEINIIVKDDFDKMLKDSDVLLLVESFLKLDDSCIEECIKKAYLMGKEIILLRKIKNEIKEKYRDAILDLCNTEELLFDADQSKSLLVKSISKPVILVLGSGEKCYKFDTQMLTRKIFLKRGYKVTQIGSKKDSNYYGFHSFPDFMYDLKYSDMNKVLYFNHFIADLCEKEDSDIIIIGVPGGICSYDETYHNEFGITNYLISNAITPDFVVFNSCYIDYPEKYFSLMKNFLKYRFNYSLDAVLLSNSYINWEATKNFSTLVYTTLKNDFVHNTAIKYNTFSIFDEMDKLKFEEQIVNTLTGYGEYEGL